MRGAQCTEAPTMSAESHWISFLVPPNDHPGVNWDHFPQEARDLPATADGTRGFVCEVYNQVSDILEQDWWQAFCNSVAMMGCSSRATHTSPGVPAV